MTIATKYKVPAEPMPVLYYGRDLVPRAPTVAPMPRAVPAPTVAPTAARDVVTSLPVRIGPGGGASGGGGTAPTVSLALDYEPARAALPVPLLVGLAVAMLVLLRRR